MISGIQPIRQSSVVSSGINSMDSAKSERFNTSPGWAFIGITVTPSSEYDMFDEEALLLPPLQAVNKQPQNNMFRKIFFTIYFKSV
jgi:hypothetical protein